MLLDGLSELEAQKNTEDKTESDFGLSSEKEQITRVTDIIKITDLYFFCPCMYM